MPVRYLSEDSRHRAQEHARRRGKKKSKRSYIEYTRTVESKERRGRGGGRVSHALKGVHYTTASMKIDKAGGEEECPEKHKRMEGRR